MTVLQTTCRCNPRLSPGATCQSARKCSWQQCSKTWRTRKPRSLRQTRPSNEPRQSAVEDTLIFANAEVLSSTRFSPRKPEGTRRPCKDDGGTDYGEGEATSAAGGAASNTNGNARVGVRWQRQRHLFVRRRARREEHGNQCSGNGPLSASLPTHEMDTSHEHLLLLFSKIPIPQPQTIQ